ncbi:ArsB/NhaD family transporter [uncultured Anaerofustis sp.]|uniref:SLC13 family permease n=1 Tax=uncultured Anaerofustis sp. TaxID=904996 RepID=UPI0025DC1EBF|nr:ArsB/NhaD family transporter [uncultured Anaerofustis sp.]
MTTTQIISVIIFLITMTAIMTERVHRTVAAIAGAILLIVTHILTIEKSISYVDMNTIGVLVGMMLFVAVVKNSGIFEYIAIKSAKIAKGKPVNIMIIFIIITAVLSAFLDNVTTVLLVGPMTIAITRILDISPVPFLITQIMASNIGGTATLVGDPPNIMIGSAANLSFTDFILNTGVPAVITLIAAIGYFLILYKKHMKVEDSAINNIMKMDENKAIKDKSLMVKSIIMIILVVVAFVFHSQLGMESCTIALTAAIIMLLFGGQDAEEVIISVEWSTILFFIGLFIVVGGLEETGIIEKLANMLINATNGNMVLTMIIILWASAIISSFLDNIPFVATLIPLIITMQQAGGIDVMPLWWALSLGACLGGNGTLIGASANVVLSSISNKNGYPITFKDYFKVGFPMMIVSIIICTGYLLIRFA